MSLTEGMVLDYLDNAERTLKDISNQDVHDNKDKTGQMPLTISIGKRLIQELLDTNKLSQQEDKALERLRDAMEKLPVSLSGLATAVYNGIDATQKELLQSVDAYAKSITEFEEHRLLLKAIVLVLKILEYDLSKKPGPITISLGYSFLKYDYVLLTEEQKKENHAEVQKLLTGFIEKFNCHYEVTEPVTAPAI